jgi:hypothetical protein
MNKDTLFKHVVAMGDRSTHGEYKSQAMTDMHQEASVRDIADSDLVCRALHNLKPTRNFPLWVRVMDAFGLGSTYAFQLCRIHGFDPDAKTKNAMRYRDEQEKQA